MASYLDKAQVYTAITDNTKLDLGHQSIMSADFMQLNVATIHELVPGSKIDVNMESFARLNPLPVPTFGRASMRNRAYFVPFRTIFRAWDDFLVDSVHVASDGYNGAASLISSVPTVDMNSLADCFRNSIGQTATDNALIYPAPSATDFDIDLPGGEFDYTIKGRQAIKLLEQLGYKVDYQVAKGVKVLSALPLLALAKIYVDWYFPQQYSNISVYDRLLAMCNYDVASGPFTLTSTDVAVILTACSFVQYDSDAFVSAWDQPNQPTAGNYSNFKLVNIDSIGQVYGNSLFNISQQNGVSNNSGNATTTSAIDRYGKMDAPFITGYVYGSVSGGSSSVSTAGISEYLLHSLHALTDYMKRHQLAGSRAFDRYLARFGKAIPAEKLNRSLYLGAAMQDIQIGDVTSTSDTVNSNTGNGAQLGGFAGKGISYGNGHFDYSTDEFGYFIILSSIVPSTGYFQGLDPLVERTTKLSFWTPEFDSLGVEPLGAINLYVPQIPAEMTAGSAYDQVFGFVPRYASYKCPTFSDRLTGNFRLGSLAGTGALAVNANNAWHLMRTFAGPYDFQSDWANVVHSPDFISGQGDFSQYKRIFYDTNADAPDNFTVIHNFEIAEYAPMKALYDEYEFEDKGKKVTLDVNGVKKN